MKKYKLFSFALLLFALIACNNSSNTSSPVDNNPGAFKFDSLTSESPTVKVNDIVKLSAHAHGSGLTYSWVASVGTIIGSGSEVEFTICHSTEITIKCTVKDGSNNSDTKEIKVKSI